MGNRKPDKTGTLKRRSTPKEGALTEGRGQKDAQPAFTFQQQGHLILFKFKTPDAQYQALARMESFYESNEVAGTYITLEEGATRGLCRGYKAFNVPVSAIREWLQEMQASGNMLQDVSNNNTSQGWWRSFTSPQEAQVLDHLSRAGCFKSPAAGAAPRYLISVSTNSIAQLGLLLHHELSHALYFLHTGYRETVQLAWNGLSKKSRSVISQDLAMREYAVHVWVDEFQAYVSEEGGESEFGNIAKLECGEVKAVLAKAQCSAWKELNLDVNVFFQG